MNIWAFDLGTKCGWANRTQGAPLLSGMNDFAPARGESPGMRFLRFRRSLGELAATGKPDIIVWEQPHNRGGAATAVLNGMEAEVLAFAAEHGIEHRAVHSSTLKKWATGKGNAGKPEMMDAAARLFPDVTLADDNHADALIALAWAIDQYEV